MIEQKKLFEEKIEFIYVQSIIGSGYETDVAKLAIEDKIAYRAARKNMQIHSAIILKIDNTFSGFFTFQVNHEAKEFCLLQSAMEKGKEDKEKGKKNKEKGHSEPAQPLLKEKDVAPEEKDPSPNNPLGQVTLSPTTNPPLCR